MRGGGCGGSGGGEAMGGGDGGSSRHRDGRAPQSEQSVHRAQSLYIEFGPPSSQLPSLGYVQVSSHRADSTGMTSRQAASSIACKRGVRMRDDMWRRRHKRARERFVAKGEYDYDDDDYAYGIDSTPTIHSYPDTVVAHSQRSELARLPPMLPGSHTPL